MQAQDLVITNPLLQQVTSPKPNPLESIGFDVQGAQNYHTDKKEQADKQAKEQPQQQEWFNYKDVVELNSSETAAKINDEKTTDTFLAINDKPQPALPSEQEHAPTETTRTIYQLGARNTGISYFDNKQNLTLLDAYIAKQLGLKTDRLVHKIDLKADINAKRTSITPIQKAGAEYANTFDTLARGFTINLVNDKSNIIGAISQKARSTLRGAYFGEATEASANNSTIYAIARLNNGFSNQLSDFRIKNAKDEYYQAQSLDQKADVMKYQIRRIRDGLVDNHKRALANGAYTTAQKDALKIKEIDQFLGLLEGKNYPQILEYIAQKGHQAPVLMGDDYQSDDYQSPTQRP